MSQMFDLYSSDRIMILGQIIHEIALQELFLKINLYYILNLEFQLVP